MKPFCSRCGELNPDPIRDGDGDLVYWFKLADVGDGPPVLYEELPPEGGQGQITLAGMTMKDFDYDGSFDLVCPQCAMEECPRIKDIGDLGEEGILDDDGWMSDDFDPFDDDAYEEFLD